MAAQTPLQSKELYDAQAPNKGMFVTHEETVAALKALGLARVANVGNTATGTELATAINGLLAALIAAGIMKSA